MKRGRRPRGRPSMFNETQKKYIFQQLASGRTAWDIAKGWSGEIIEQNISYYQRKYKKDLIMIDWMFNLT